MFWLTLNLEFNDARRALFFTDCNFFLTSWGKNIIIDSADYSYTSKLERFEALKKWELNSKI